VDLYSKVLSVQGHRQELILQLRKTIRSMPWMLIQFKVSQLAFRNSPFDFALRWHIVVMSSV